MELHSAFSRSAATGVTPREQVAGYTWATAEEVKSMSIFNDIAIFVDMAHYIISLDALGYLGL